MMYDVITFGSAVLDVFMGTKARERKGRIEYKAGAKIIVKDIDFQVGGCAVNVAAGLRKMGCTSGFVGKIGNDDNGRTIVNEVGRKGVFFLGVRGEGKSGFSVVLDSVKHDRTILHYRGINDSLRPDEVGRGELRSRWFYFGSAQGQTLEAHKFFAGFASENGIKIAFNPGMAECEMGQTAIGKILEKTEILTLNMEEAVALARTRRKVPKEIIKALLAMGPKIVCITNGPKHVLCSDGKYLYELSPHKVKVNESTGAGDAFSSGLLGGILRGLAMDKAMQIGLANSEAVLKGRGATANLLGWLDAEKAVKSNPGVMKRKLLR